uniref:hypothetical protein n=1 Tax=Actinosynnema sp. TaxID=1872144 RepID=UPI003F86CB24
LELDRLAPALQARELTPDDALDRLRALRDGLSTHLDALAGAVAATVGATSAERDLVTKEMRTQQRLRRREPSILATADPTYLWFATGAFSTGLQNGTSAVQQSRSSAGSGGSTSGYSGGGSFSGAGSSSRF